MADPVIQKTWTIAPNNVIANPFVSLNATMGEYLFGVASFLLANGYTCKGSSDGVAGAMDGVNRWAAAANAQTRGANATSVQSWMALTDGNGCDVLLAYVGATDDVGRISFSAAGTYVAAATATHTPTSADEVICYSNTLINATASLSRIWFGWVDSEAKLCRFVVARSSACISVWGVELVDPRGSNLAVPVIGWGIGGSAFIVPNFLNLVTPTGGFYFQGGVSTIVNSFATYASTVLTFEGVITENQSSVGYGISGPLGVGGQTNPRRGIVGTFFDLWGGLRAGGSPGDTWNAQLLVAFTSGDPILMPWDGVTVPNVGGGGGTQTGQAFGFENPEETFYGSWQNGISLYVPNSNSNVTPDTGAAPKTINRRAGVGVIRLNDRTDDPPAEAGRSLLYSRVIGGRQSLFCRYPDGTVTFMAGAATS